MNKESLAQLKSAVKTLSKPAYLQIKGQDKGFYAFNYNPEIYTDKLTANYGSVAPMGANVPYLDFVNGSGTTRTFSGLLMDTYSDGLSLRVIIEGIKDLMYAHPDKGEYEPPTLEFHWGTDAFKPCKLVDFRYDITHLLGGEPAKGTADLTLTLIPDQDPAKLSTTEAAKEKVKQQAIVTGGNSVVPVSLTHRQQNDGIKIAVDLLKQNLFNVSPSVKNAVKTGKYTVAVDSNNNVILYDKAGKSLLNIGIYSGINFISNMVKK